MSVSSLFGASHAKTTVSDLSKGASEWPIRPLRAGGTPKTMKKRCFWTPQGGSVVMFVVVSMLSMLDNSGNSGFGVSKPLSSIGPGPSKTVGTEPKGSKSVVLDTSSECPT
jgi:hypothetical protein